MYIYFRREKLATCQTRESLVKRRASLRVQVSFLSLRGFTWRIQRFCRFLLFFFFLVRRSIDGNTVLAGRIFGNDRNINIPLRFNWQPAHVLDYTSHVRSRLSLGAWSMTLRMKIRPDQRRVEKKSTWRNALPTVPPLEICHSNDDIRTGTPLLTTIHFGI